MRRLLVSFTLALLPLLTACTSGSSSGTGIASALALHPDQLPPSESDDATLNGEPDPSMVILVVGNTQQTCSDPVLKDAIDDPGVSCDSTVWQARVHVPSALVGVGEVDLHEIWTVFQMSIADNGGCAGGDGAGGNIDGTLDIASVDASHIEASLSGIDMTQIASPAGFDPNGSFTAQVCY